LLSGRKIERHPGARSILKSGQDLSISNFESRYLLAVRVFLCVATLGLGALLAYRQVFTGLLPSDDEGGLLLSLLNYLKHGRLYTSTFAQYGPFYFYAQQTMHGILHLPVNHDGARSLTLVYWLLASLLPFCFIYRLTRSLPLASVAFLLTLIIGKALCSEPGHPQEVILVLVQCALILSTLATGRWSLLAFLGIGMIAAFLCLIKINVGVFFLFAVTMSLTAVLTAARSRKLLWLTASVVSILMPLVLMHAHFRSDHDFSLFATLCIGVLTLTIKRVAVKDPLTGKHIAAVLAGFAAGTILVLFIALKQGISARSLLDGIVLSPLRHPAVFFAGFYPSRDQWLMSGLLSVSTIYLWIFQETLGLHRSLLGAIKLFSAFAVMIMLWINFPISIGIVLPLLPILYLVPSGEQRSVEWLMPRLLLSFIVGFEFLQAYPVAGSQFAIALAPGAAWASLLFFDGSLLIGNDSLRLEVFERHASRASLGLQIILLFMMWYSDFDIRSMGPSLDLPGARHVHASEQELVIYRTLANEIAKHCDNLFTMPGMGSLNLWSERPTPNGYNLTAWMTAFTLQQQQDIVLVLKRTNRPCVVYNPKLVEYWMPQGESFLSTSPIARYVFQETRTISSISDYQLRIPANPTR
jgi:hypothetical protein